MSVERFIVIEGSGHGCCFSHTVVDTSFGKESYGDYWKKQMCECDEEEAILITAALNEHCQKLAPE